MYRLITFSGLDGSGKSTQIELFKNYLKTQGKTFWYFHGARSSVSSLYKTLPIFSWKKTKEKAKKDEGVTKANWIEIQLRKVALMIDICRFKRLMKKTKVDYIISDRYFYDSVVNIEYLLETGLPNRIGNRVSKLFAESIIPNPNFAFFIKVSPEKIMSRERKPDQGIEYLKAKEKLFEKKIKNWRLIVIDGERSKDKVSIEIINRIRE